jgi:hypothetical protein
MSDNSADRAPEPTAPDLEHRQLTLGECLALARYGEALHALGQTHVELWQVLKMVDSMRVCTTCGWPEHLHTGPGTVPILDGICAHFMHR